MKGLGVRAGVPDIIAVKDGRAYGLERKAPGGRLSAVQRNCHAALAAAGATAGSLDDALGLRAALGLAAQCFGSPVYNSGFMRCQSPGNRKAGERPA